MKSRFALACLLPLLAANPAAMMAETLPGPIPADIVRVIDGDTIRVRAHIWIGQEVDILVRLADVDAPEIHRPECTAEREMADRAKAELEALLTDTLFLIDVHTGKYSGRIIADAQLPDGRSLGVHLLDAGLAVPYGTDDPWCADVADTANALP